MKQDNSKAVIAIVMWIAWGLGVIALAFNSPGNAESLGIFGAIILGVVTVRLFRDPD